MEYYQNLITEKSFKTLQDLRKKYKFILIGGWAVFLYTHSLKSKDIDLIIEYEELEKLRKSFSLNKNDRLKKYEINIDEIDIDLYLPFYSKIGIPVEEIRKHSVNLEGFIVPKPEVLLILKQIVYKERLGTPKGSKDKVDIIALLNLNLDFKFYKKLIKEYKIKNCLKELKDLLEAIIEIPELRLNQFKYSKIKKKVLEGLKNN